MFRNRRGSPDGLPRLAENAADVIGGVQGDIAAQKQAEAALTESEAQLRLALASAEMVVWRWDLLTGEVSFSGDAVSVFAIAEPPATFEGLFACVHPDDHDALLQAAGQCRGRGHWSVDVRVVGDDGVARWTTSRGNVIRDELGHPIATLGVTFDVSERHLADAAHREAAEALEAVVTAAPMAIVAIDRDEHVWMWNPAAERIFGWSRQEVVGRVPPYTPPEKSHETAEWTKNVFQGISMADFEAVRVRKDGTRLSVNLAFAPLRDAKGEIAGAICLLTDISAQVEARQKLDESYKLLQEIDAERCLLVTRLVHAQEEERQRIAADIHDDSVQVLTALALNLELLQKKTPDAEPRRALHELEQTARLSVVRLRQLIFELRPPALDRDGLVAALRLYLEQMRRDRGIEYGLESALDSEPSWEMRAILYRIAQEAMLNVAKHAQAGRVEVRLDRLDGGIQIVVADDGTGFAHDAAGSSEPGHLGLAAMRERAEMAGGRFRLEATAGAGTRVEFWVPDSNGTAGDEIGRRS